MLLKPFSPLKCDTPDLPAILLGGGRHDCIVASGAASLSTDLSMQLVTGIMGLQHLSNVRRAERMIMLSRIWYCSKHLINFLQPHCTSPQANMRAFVLLLAMLPLLHAATIDWEKSLDEEFIQWKKYFEKTYETAEEEVMRKLTWKRNFQNIQKHNLEHSLGKHRYTLEMNHFGDLNASEFKGRINGFDNKMRLKRQGTVVNMMYLPPLNVADDHLPKEVDWRKHGYVTPVKDQGQCGSCWAFSTTGSLEGQHFRKTGKLVSLSEQNLVDCSRKEGNMGCEGGLMDQAFEYIKLQKGLDDEADYPYEAKDSRCRYQEKYNSANDTGYVDIPQGNEKMLKKAVAHVGPISVAIDASHQSFQFYSHGVYDEPQCSSEQLDHGVLVVGYGTDTEGGDYWIVKNSWATTWGQQGYIWMSRNKDNQCGIATSASYPTV